MHIEWVLKQPGKKGRPISLCSAAAKLNERNIESPMGGRWQGGQLKRMACRLGIHHPISPVSDEAARARIREVWKEHPEFTTKQIRANLGLPHPLGINRTWALVKECRMAAAKRSPLHEQAGWRLDCWTSIRVRVIEIWKQHPELTAIQIAQRLGPKQAMRVEWVHRVVRRCWLASARQNPKLWRMTQRRPRWSWRHLSRSVG